MKRIIKKLIPEPFKPIMRRYLNIYNLLVNYLLDFRRYLKYSANFGFYKSKTKDHYERDLLYFYHSIEKGLSLPKPRVGFGKESIKQLVSLINFYVGKYGWNNVSVEALNTLYSYYNFNKKNGLVLESLFDDLERFSDTLLQDKKLNEGGVIELYKEDIDNSNINFREFAYSRFSIRNFADSDVSLDLIKEAVEIAQKSPSVCNRQSSRVYVYSDTDVKKNVLKFQNGNSGFGENASKILIVTSKTEYFMGSTERNQSYIDGGLYAMSLLYGLHSQGVGACALNLCIDHGIEKKLKKVANIGDSEVLIMMIAVGNIPEKLKVAASPRRNVSEVISIY